VAPTGNSVGIIIIIIIKMIIIIIIIVGLFVEMKVQFIGYIYGYYTWV
jgi:hypothetical protein